MIVASFAGSLRAVALLDRDLHSVESADSNVALLPVSMIENFLVDPDSIWQAIQSIVEKTDLLTPADVAAALDTILTERTDAEAERRVLGDLGITVFRPHAPVSSIEAQVVEHEELVKRTYAKEAVAAASEKARGALDLIKTDMKRRELFDGKAALNDFVRRKLHASGMSKQIFLYETARHASKRKSVSSFFEQFFGQLLGQQPQSPQPKSTIGLGP